MNEQMVDKSYTLFAFFGQLKDLDEPNLESLQFEHLPWADVVELCRLSFEQGFTVALWPTEGQGTQND